MKSLLILKFLMLLFFCSGCDLAFSRNFNASRKIPPVESVDTKEGGMYFTIKNLLAQNKPNLSIIACPYNEHDEEDDAKKENKQTTEASRNQFKKCFLLDKLIPYKDSATFHVSKRHLEELRSESNISALALEFNDSYSRAGFHWHCFENTYIHIPKDVTTAIHYKVTVTQSNIVTYSCRLKQVKID